MGLWFHKIIHETLMSCDSAQVEKKNIVKPQWCINKNAFSKIMSTN